jgi:hypothetical protein
MQRHNFILKTHKSPVKKIQLGKRAINDIMKEFDFNTTHDVFQFLDWRWNDGRVPSVVMLRKTARELLDNVNEKGLDYCMTGGLKAFRDEDDSVKGLGLAFVLTEYTHWDYK